MPQPEWHVDKYQEAQRLIKEAQEFIGNRRQGNVRYMGDCTTALEKLATVVDAIRTTS